MNEFCSALHKGHDSGGFECMLTLLDAESVLHSVSSSAALDCGEGG